LVLIPLLSTNYSFPLFSIPVESLLTEVIATIPHTISNTDKPIIHIVLFKIAELSHLYNKGLVMKVQCFHTEDQTDVKIVCPYFLCHEFNIVIVILIVLEENVCFLSCFQDL
jgi:hypothetical protein